MNDPLEIKLRETSWRRPLTAAEQAELQAWLEAHPEARPNWEAKAGLSGVREKIPAPPVSSNFTARVLQAIEREERAPQRRRSRIWSWRWVLPKVAFATVVVVVGLFTYNERAAARRMALA